MAKSSAAREEQEAEGQEQAAGTRPAARFNGSGGLSVAVWKHKTDEGYDRYSVRVDRTYMNKDGQFETTPYLRDGDLLRTGKLLEQADQWIEQDKGKYRSGGQSQEQGQGR